MPLQGIAVKTVKAPVIILMKLLNHCQKTSSLLYPIGSGPTGHEFNAVTGM